ncbi:hypothetical protein FOA52_007050 [Chlamydomonas sp. UWO 241]|nr:hypothetical protein FOA52_007050 [Chlamydomonas sp. UWO 241]
MQHQPYSALAWNSDENVAAIAAAGAIAPLVQLLRPGSPDLAQWAAANALWLLAANAKDAVAITAAGAIPLLVPLSLPGSPVIAHMAAVGALRALGADTAEKRAAIAAATTASAAALLREMAGLDIGSGDD